jgi:hypothetical protein
MEWFYIKRSLHHNVYVVVGKVLLKEVLTCLLEDEHNLVLNYVSPTNSLRARSLQLQLDQLDNFEAMGISERFKPLSLVDGLSTAFMEDTIKQQVDELYSEDSELYSPVGYANMSSIGLDNSEIFTKE